MAYSPPLPLISLAPPLRRSDLRPVSIISAASGTTIASTTTSPPSAYYRRSRSSELLKGIPLVLPLVLDITEHPNVGVAGSAAQHHHHRLVVSSLSNMATTPQPLPKKPGFFRRMSLSSSQSSKASVHANIGAGNAGKSKGRSVSGPGVGGGTVAGPSYDALPLGAAPSAFRGGDRSDTAGVRHQNASSHPPVSTPIASSFGKSRSPPPTSSNMSPPRSRQPIRPALASPPSTTARRLSASSPYDLVQPSISPPRPSGQQNGLSGRDREKENPPAPAWTVQTNTASSSERSVLGAASYNYQTSHNLRDGRAITPQHATPVRPIPTPLKIPGNERQTPRSSSQPVSAALANRFDDAEANDVVQLPAGAQAPAFARSKMPETRPMVSARRSTSSSRRTPTAKVESRMISPTAEGMVTSPMQTRPAGSTRPEIRSQNKSESPDTGTAKSKEQLTEAGAYAKSIAATISHRDGPPRTNGHPATSQPSKSSASRPLPMPPPTANGVSRSSSKANVVVIASSPKSHKSTVQQEQLGDKPASQTLKNIHPAATPTRSSPVKALTPPVHEQPRSSSQALDFNFPRSPTLPPLVDPRTRDDGVIDPVTQWSRDKDVASSPAPLTSSQLPPRQSSSAVRSHRNVSSPLTSPVMGSVVRSPKQVPNVNGHNPVDKTKFKDRPRATITFLLLHNSIQAAFLSQLSINSFLSLTGASDSIRKRFTGEAIGRWVMKEWGIQLDREKGRSWPNLTVWEGFLESLLHDPITYSTYPPQWHNLLQHLCLSHTLIVLHLRQLPVAAFPNPPPLPFEDDFAIAAPHLPFSNSMNSLGSQRPRSRLGSAAGSDAGSLAPTGKMPRQERLVEIVMPEPLASVEQQQEPTPKLFPDPAQKARRRGSIGSIASATSMSFVRRRSASISTDARVDLVPVSSAAPMASGKAALPPVSYPSAKRYGFKRHGEPARSRQSSETSRPGSIFSVQSTPSFSGGHQRASSAFSTRQSFAVDRNAPPVPGFPVGLPMPPPIGGGQRSSFASSDARSSRPSENGGISPKSGLILSRRELYTPPLTRPEPVFDRPIPYTVGRAPILRVFVPLSDRVQRWPSSEGAAIAVKELEKCGAMRRMKLGDLVVNTAIRQPRTTEHVLVFVPFVRHLLVPLEYSFAPTGHLPSYVNGFDLPPSFYYPFLPTPQILYLDLAPFARQALQSIRLAYDRRDVTTASGARLSAKRYLHVAGFEVGPQDRVAPEWQGMVSLETEGTAEARQDLEKRLIGVGGARPLVGPWELVRDKSMIGTIWLRLVKQGP
ncbi:uncharacterized protein I303_107898 [Kwoniella dejecticola CBS 10117]|uniref:Uncharacterized protein n=1 Tax=Kwoniella dejecticola CBS 10117 TaxID=1296121 RepID=A0A1A5ZW00_9TREE|nr:uncharacterized protein I303_07899 [Kwoniella dejecticola CBS 10117]OBR81986.1 hypothetical protein I303_07899 [Kwoniella dejecticola CBS 10117]